MPEHRLAADPSEDRRLAWLHRNAVKHDLPAAISTSMIRSRSPTELPPEKMTMSCASARVDRRHQRVEVSGAVGKRHRHAAVRRHDRRQRVAVDVVDLPGLERAARRDDFIAGREDRDLGPGEDVDVGRADRGQRAEAARGSGDRRAAAMAWPAVMSAPRRPTCCRG